MSRNFSESTIEEATLELFAALGCPVLHGPEIAPGELFEERTQYSDVLLFKRLKDALAPINTKIPAAAIEDAVRKLVSLKDARSLFKLRRFLSQMEEGDRKVLMFMAQKMARRKAV